MKKNFKSKEVKNLRKSILVMFLMFLTIVLAYGYADAISGVCSNCHTMHNSQNNAAEAEDYLGADLAAQEQLLKSNCIGCHATTGTGQLSNIGGPAVLHAGGTATGAQGASETLAGGDFYWVNAGDSAKGHDVIDLPGISGKDSNMPDTEPPGWDQAATTGESFDSKSNVVTGSAGWTSKQLTCAGTFGCHGTRHEEGFGGLTGAHHNNTGGTSSQVSSPSTVGNSYRFLAGIKGLENDGWNWAETASTHNEYYGTNYTADRSAGANYGTKDTISFLCAECHGVFHGTIDGDSTSGSPWVRHPTDIMLPNSGEYADYNPDNANVYSVEAPVARPTVPASSSDSVTPGTDAIVMCLSCHRAHGSPQNDLLRWDYSSIQAGTGTTDNGCFVCHTTKNND
jgi:predicted CXXCH cytochrome family protein